LKRKHVTATSPLTNKKQPFGLLAEGLFLKNNRDDKTPVELFVEGLAGWDGLTRRLIGGGTAQTV